MVSKSDTANNDHKVENFCFLFLVLNTGSYEILKQGQR